MTIYNHKRDAYIEFDISDTLKNFINNIKNLCNISHIVVRLYDINDILDHFYDIKDEKCHTLYLESWTNDDDVENHQYITNVGIDAYDYNTWKDFEDLMIAKTVLVNENSSKKDVYIVNTGLEWTDYEEVTLQIFVNGLRDCKEKE